MKDLFKKSMQGIEYITIKEIDGGIQVRRKKLNDSMVIPYTQTLLRKALKDIAELKSIPKEEKEERLYSIDELVQEMKKESSDFVLTPCTPRDRVARIVSLIQESFAILAYIYGKESLEEYIN